MNILKAKQLKMMIDYAKLHKPKCYDPFSAPMSKSNNCKGAIHPQVFSKNDCYNCEWLCYKREKQY